MMVAPLLAALLLSANLAQAPASTAVVRVPVANVWKAPDAGHLPLDPHVWPTAALSYAQRIALVGHMPTQALYGEQVVVLGKRGAWTHVAIPDQPSPLDARGYPGWIRSWQLGPVSKLKLAQTVVTARTAKLSNGTEVGYGSAVFVGAVPAAATRARPHTRADLVASAKQFLGLHYLWGGLSAWGYDCSGLTWAVYRTHGITIPRDADAQFTEGKPVALARVLPGDLLFYERPVVGHVALAIGNGRMIEAPNSRSEVRIVPVRTSEFRGARRFL